MTPKLLENHGLRAAAGLVCLSVVSLLSACASLSEDECRIGDWRGIGFSDGAAGTGLDILEKHREACAEYGVAPNLDAYMAGRNQGLSEFCQPSSGYRQGMSGRDYEGVCSNFDEPAFIEAYHAGLRIRALQNEKKNLDREIDGNDSRIDEIVEEIEALGGDLSTGEAQEAFKSKVLELANERVFLEEENAALADEIEHLEIVISNKLEKDRLRFGF